MPDTTDVVCQSCAGTLFKYVEYQPARADRKFLWWIIKGHEARVRFVCAHCNMVQYMAPGTFKVNKHISFNKRTGETIEHPL